MSKKEMVVTNTLGYKICNFFKKFFSINFKKENDANFIDNEHNNRNFRQSISYTNEIKNLYRKKELANQLMSKKISVIDLSDSEVDEMTEYFNFYINDIKQKLV